MSRYPSAMRRRDRIDPRLVVEPGRAEPDRRNRVAVTKRIGGSGHLSILTYEGDGCHCSAQLAGRCRSHPLSEIFVRMEYGCQKDVGSKWAHSGSSYAPKMKGNTS